MPFSRMALLSKSFQFRSLQGLSPGSYGQVLVQVRALLDPSGANSRNDGMRILLSLAEKVCQLLMTVIGDSTC